jgi:hypothetical protein
MDALVLSVLAVLKECVSVRDELERLQSDQGVAANLYRKVHHERQPREEAINDFFEVLQPLMNKMQSMTEVLEQQLQQLQGNSRASARSGEMLGIQEISDEIKRREEVIAKYTKALESHAQVFAAIRQGWIIYTDLGDDIKQTLARARNFAASRKLAAMDVERRHVLPSVVKKRKFVFFSCRISTKIATEGESQKLKDLFEQYKESIQYEHHPCPKISHFTDELIRIQKAGEDVSLHFSGHGDGRSGSLCWHGVAGRRQKEMQIRGKQLATLIKLKDAVAHIDSFFLNACCTLATGLELHAIGVRVVVCWQSPVTDRTARDFATRFYELSCRDSGQYAKAFETACNEMSGALLEARPCLLQTGSGQPERPGVQIWNGTELVPIADELLHSPHFLQPTAPPLELPGGAGLDSAPLESYVSRSTAEAEDYDDEEDVYKNWRPPKQDTDFAAHAGQAEKAVLQKLGFNLLLSGKEIGVLNGKEIGGSHGLDAQGFLTPDALRAIGIGNYTRLWRKSGKAVEEARKMLLHEKCSAAAREQVRLARNDLERSIFYRQLDVMAYR